MNGCMVIFIGSFILGRDFICSKEKINCFWVHANGWDLYGVSFSQKSSTFVVSCRKNSTFVVNCLSCLVSATHIDPGVAALILLDLRINNERLVLT